MVKEGRRIGRPRGSGKNDTPCLTRVADLLLGDPTLKPTTAMKRVITARTDWGTTDETLIRRWQVKWKTSGAELLRAAQERRARQENRTASTTQALQHADRLFLATKLQHELPDFVRATRNVAGFYPVSKFANAVPEYARKALEPVTKSAAWRALDNVPDRMLFNRYTSGVIPTFAGQIPEHIRTVMETVNRIEKSGVIQTYERLRAMGLLK